MTGRRFRSFAKVNLGLEVIGKRPDGYHELKTLFATIGLHDILSIAPARSGITVRCDQEGVPTDETNLAHRAALVMQRLSGRKSGVTIEIRKRIPVGGGLGGGSSNAATVLRALDLIWELGLGATGLGEVARSLGADVPFFLYGGTALGLGRGDVIRPLELRLRERMVLVPGQGGVSTAAVFKRFAARRGPSLRRSRIDAFLRTRENPSLVPRSLGTLRNELESAAVAESPALADTSRQIRRVGRLTGAALSAMSGSGSSFFLLFDERAAAAATIRFLREGGVSARRCAFVSRKLFQSRFEIATTD